MSDDALPSHVLNTVRDEFRKLRSMGDRALAQVTTDEAFHARLDDTESNSLAIIIRHVAGNMRSRWTDFLTSDGEKTSRDRDHEFALEDRESRADLIAMWTSGWDLTLATLDALTVGDLMRTITIRKEQLTVCEALLRQLTHYSAHAGQIVLLSKHLAGNQWKTLTIPRGESKKKDWSYKAGSQTRE